MIRFRPCIAATAMCAMAMLSACASSSDQLGADGIGVPPGSPVCSDAVGDAAAMQGPGEPAGNAPPPHVDLTEAALGLDEDSLSTSFTFADDTPEVGERAAYDDLMVMVTLYVDGRARYILAADRDQEGAYVVAGTELADDGQGRQLSFETMGYSIDGPTLTISASREDLAGLEDDVRWMAEARATDANGGQATPPAGAGGAPLTSFDTCPNLTDVEASQLGGMAEPDGTTSRAAEDVLEKLPEGP